MKKLILALSIFAALAVPAIITATPAAAEGWETWDW